MNNISNSAIGTAILNVVILAAMTALLVTHTITYIEAVPFLLAVTSVFGIHVAASSPSPSQQQQLNDQQASLQQLVQQLTTTILPAVFQAHPVAQSAPSSAVQPVAPPPVNAAAMSTAIPPAAQFVPSSLAALQTSQMPAIVPPETK